MSALHVVGLSSLTLAWLKFLPLSEATAWEVVLIQKCRRIIGPWLEAGPLLEFVAAGREKGNGEEHFKLF